MDEEIIRNDEDKNIIPYSDNKISKGMFVCVLVAIVLIVVYLIIAGYGNSRYATYEVVDSKTREDTKNASYIQYYDGYIRYSNDGIAYYVNGSAVWNHSYEIINIQINRCGEYIVVGDISGHYVYIYNKSGFKKAIDVSLPITEVDIAENGVVAVTLEDGNSSYINRYDIEGNNIGSIKIILQKSGYPLDIAISDDGEKIAVSCVKVNGQVVKNDLVFYDYSGVGENYNDKIVGLFTYDKMIGKVDFIDNNTVLVISEDKLSIYNIKHIPELKCEANIESRIQKIFYNENYVGLVHNNNGTEKYLMEIYDMSCKKICEKTYNENYNNFIINNNQIMMYNQKKAQLMTLRGKVRYEGVFDIPVDCLLPIEKSNDYTMINAQYIKKIRLR